MLNSKVPISICLAAVVIFTTLACGLFAPKPTPAIATPAPGSGGVSPRLAGVRGTTSDGGWILSWFEIIDPLPLKPAVTLAPGTRLVAVEMRFENISGKEIFSDPANFALVSDDGQRVSGTLSGVDKGMPYTKTKPGFSYSGRVGFEVPDGMAYHWLEFNGSSAAGPVLRLALLVGAVTPTAIR
jgi:hypothetical protein